MTAGARAGEPTAVGGEAPAAVRARLLEQLYGAEVGARVAAEVEALLARHRVRAGPARLWDEHDAWLIAYPDQFSRPGEAPLATLRAVMEDVFDPWFNGLHVTPFFPSTSDEGFAVSDYLAVDERYGTWQDVEALGHGRRLAIDAVLNHLSAGSDWFRRFLAGDPEYAGFFRTAEPDADLAAVVRPRTHPLLTRFDGAGGPVWAWTTFSEDQVDLDYRTPEVLVRVLEVLIAYIEHGANILRLDAVAFLFKQEGTASIHLPETHAVVQFLRSCVEAVDPSVLVLTETNVRHEENVGYFGAPGADQAHIVYQFPLPPLTLHALLTGDASRLRAWAATLEPLRAGTAFLNFLASHDGVGIRPAEGVLEPADVDLLVAAATALGRGDQQPHAGRRHDHRLRAERDLVRADGGRAPARARAAAPPCRPRGHVRPARHPGHVRAVGGGRRQRSRALRAYRRGALAAPAALRRRGGLLARREEPRHPRRSGLAGPARDAGGPRGDAGLPPRQRPDRARHAAAVFAVERVAADGERARVYVNVSGEPCAVGVPHDGARWSSLVGGPAPEGERLVLPPWSSAWLDAAPA